MTGCGLSGSDPTNESLNLTSGKNRKGSSWKADQLNSLVVHTI